MSTDRIHRFRVYMEGILVPAEAVSIFVSVDQPARAALELTPTASAFYAPERTMVHVFWWEEESSAWLRIFEGETVSKKVEYQAGRRRPVYYCQDSLLYWQQAHRLFFSVISLQTVSQFQQSNVPALAGQSATIRSFLGLNTTEGASNHEGLVRVSDVLGSSFTNDANETIPNGINYLLERTTQVNDYWKYAESRVKLRSRITSVHSDTARAILNARNGVTNDKLSLVSNDQATVWELFSVLADQLFYQITPNPSAPYYRRPIGSTETIRDVKFDDGDDLSKGLGSSPQVTFRPEALFSQPPRCNVMLPPLIYSFSFDDQHQRAPTRTMVRVPSALTSFGTIIFAPEAAKPFIEQEDGLALTPEEVERGFIPADITVPPAEFRQASDASEDAGSSGGTKGRREDIVNYKHWRMVFGTRTAQGTGPFNPFLSAGYPAAVIDRDFGHVVGTVASLSHSLDLRQGMATTSFALSHCRHVSLPDAAYVSEEAKQRETMAPEALYAAADGSPAWYDKAYTDRNIPSVYADLLGASGVIEGEETMPQALARLAQKFFGLDETNKKAMAWDLVRRPVATLFEAFLQIGAEPVGDTDVPDGDSTKPITDHKTSNVDDFAKLRTITPEFQNPGGAFQSGDVEGGQAKGPFLTRKREWATQYRKEALERGLV